MTHQSDVLAAGQKGANLSWCVRARIVMLNNDSSALVRFSNFSENFRQTNCGVPLRMDRPTMLMWNSRHMTSFAEKTGHHLLRSDFSTNNFRWKDPHGGLLLCCGLIRTYDLINFFWGIAIVLFQHFFRPINRNLLFERLSNCAASNENQSFLRPAIHAILNISCCKKCPSMPLSHGMSHDDVALSVHARHQCSLTQRLFLDKLHGTRLWVSVGHNLIY